MSTTLQWIANNLSLGGLLRNSASVIGSATNYTVQGVGFAASHFIEDPTTKSKIRETCCAAGKIIDEGLTKGGEIAGTGVNKIVQFTGEVVGEASGGIAKLAGASEENIILAKKIGTVAGAAGVGILASAGIGSVAVSLSAASGTAGAAATTSGLAALGGGSIAAGGGGMAAGQAIVNGLIAGGAASGAATLKAE